MDVTDEDRRRYQENQKQIRAATKETVETHKVIFYDFFRDEVQKFRLTNSDCERGYAAFINTMAILPWEDLAQEVKDSWESAMYWAIAQEIEYSRGIRLCSDVSKILVAYYVTNVLNLFDYEFPGEEMCSYYAYEIPSAEVWKNTFKRFFSYLNYHGKETDPEKAPILTDVQPY